MPPNPSFTELAIGTVEQVKAYCKALGKRWIWRRSDSIAWTATTSPALSWQSGLPEILARLKINHLSQPRCSSSNQTEISFHTCMYNQPVGETA